MGRFLLMGGGVVATYSGKRRKSNKMGSSTEKEVSGLMGFFAGQIHKKSPIKDQDRDSSRQGNRKTRSSGSRGRLAGNITRAALGALREVLERAAFGCIELRGGQENFARGKGTLPTLDSAKD